MHTAWETFTLTHATSNVRQARMRQHPVPTRQTEFARRVRKARIVSETLPFEFARMHASEACTKLLRVPIPQIGSVPRVPKITTALETLCESSALRNVCQGNMKRHHALTQPIEFAQPAHRRNIVLEIRLCMHARPHVCQARLKPSHVQTRQTGFATNAQKTHTALEVH